MGEIQGRLMSFTFAAIYNNGLTAEIVVRGTTVTDALKQAQQVTSEAFSRTTEAPRIERHEPVRIEA
ncbi:hypothetical protein [Microbacterium sp.]|uniref:hypothetical protein n=1 Tax=Microbacterium sp. TaxID=51671 RepID=UPI003F94FACA